MTDDVHRQLQTDILQMASSPDGNQLVRIQQLQLDLWAYRDQQIAAQASVANLEWRLIQFDRHAKGLESELDRIRKELISARKQLARVQTDFDRVRSSWTFRIGRIVMFVLWPLRIFVHRSKPLEDPPTDAN